VEEHLGLLRELGGPAATAALGVGIYLARLAGLQLLRPRQRDAALRLLIFLTVLEVSFAHLCVQQCGKHGSSSMLNDVC